MNKIGFVGILIFVLCIYSASAATITVCPSGCDYTDIQSAINAASAGDTIVVGDGEYTGFTINKSVSVVAENRYGAVINSTVTIDADNVLLEGLDISSPSPSISMSIGHSNLTFTHLKITEFNSQNADGIMSDVTFDNVTAVSVSDFWIEAYRVLNVSFINSHLNVNLLAITGNSSAPDPPISGIYMKNLTLISPNGISFQFGGLGSNFTVENVTILDSYLNSSGVMGLSVNTNFIVKNSTIEANQTILMSSDNLILENSTIKSKYSFCASGYCYGAVTPGNNSIIANNTIENPNGICLSPIGFNNIIYLNSFTNCSEIVNTTLCSFGSSLPLSFYGFSGVCGLNHLNSSKEFTYLYNGETYTSRLGNYYDGLSCTDADGNGVCDDPQVFDANNTDYYPLVQLASLYLPAPSPTPTPTPTATITTTPVPPEAPVIVWVNKEEYLTIPEGNYTISVRLDRPANNEWILNGVTVEWDNNTANPSFTHYYTPGEYTLKLVAHSITDPDVFSTYVWHIKVEIIAAAPPQELSYNILILAVIALILVVAALYATRKQ